MSDDVEILRGFISAEEAIVHLKDMMRQEHRWGNDMNVRAIVAAIAAIAAQDEDAAWCAECGVKLENVRPGKHQHPLCSQAPQEQVEADDAPR